VCDEGWTDNDAAVICNYLGYSYYRAEATRGMVFGLSDETPVLQNPMCNGTEYYLSDCPGYDLNNVTGVTGDYCLRTIVSVDVESTKLEFAVLM
jgi:hypothetical protein